MSEAGTLYYESLARRAGYRVIAGVDEAGRGPLAGPVVAAAVIVPDGARLEGVKDSKLMSEKARERAFSFIIEQAVAVSVGVVSHRYIDEFNILKATLEAMRRAVLSLDPEPEFFLVDGTCPVPVSIPQRCLKKGDQLSLSISAASIIAKVYRDRIMHAYHDMFPVYGFSQNKGYGTRRHLEAIQKYGCCPLHRMSFKRVR
ncbi:MAG: ribonuclease HII [Deltaproteobacteria bacterium]|nr:ribonuclease HII [Deltaproteobacteria bacterium]